MHHFLLTSFRYITGKCWAYNTIEMNSTHLPHPSTQRLSVHNACIISAGAGLSMLITLAGRVWMRTRYTQRNIFEILLNQPGIRLCLPFSDWFGTKRTSVWFQINREMVYTIWFRVDSTRFRKYFSVCIQSEPSKLKDLLGRNHRLMGLAALWIY